jgi:sterol 14alpha-demethylase
MAELTIAAPLSAPPGLDGPPVVGHALQFMKNPVALIQRGLAEKGPIFSLRMGNKPAVVVLGPDSNRFFFEQTDKLLSIREAYPFFRKMFHERLYFFADPPEYKEQRAILLPFFQGKKMANYVGVMARETVAFMDRLGDEGEFDVAPTLGPLVMNVAAGAFLGDDFRQRLPEEFFQEFRDFSGGIDFVLPLWLPIPRFLRSARAKTRIHRMLQALIDQRRQKPRVPADFLQNLVEARYSDSRPVPDYLIINLIIVLVWAGHETTAAHTSWALVDLLRNPDYLKVVRQEQEQVLAGREELNLEDLHRLTRLEWAIQESERLNPVAWVLMRRAAVDFTLGGYQIDRGTLVFASPAVSHRLPQLFAAPDRYDPDRFGPGREEAKRPYTMIGFGGGVHRCAGFNFAYQEMKVIVSLLLGRYDLELIDPDPRAPDGAKPKWPQSPCRIRYRRK